MPKRKSYRETGEMRVTRSQSKLEDHSQESSATASPNQEVLSGAPAAYPASSFKNLSRADKTHSHYSSFRVAEKFKEAKSISMPKQCKAVNEADLEGNLCTDSSSKLQAVIDKILGPVKIPPRPAFSLKNTSQTEYKVKENLMPILGNILEKYGDIAANYIMKTPEGRSSVLEDVCELIYTFQEKKFGELTLFEIEKAVALVTDFERAGLKVDWLKQRLEDILDTRKVIKQPTSLKEARDKTNQVINEKKRKVEEYEALMVVLQARIAVFQEKMAMLEENVSLTKKELHAAETEAERIKETISNAKAKVIYYTEHSPLDELL